MKTRKWNIGLIVFGSGLLLAGIFYRPNFTIWALAILALFVAAVHRSKEEGNQVDELMKARTESTKKLAQQRDKNKIILDKRAELLDEQIKEKRLKNEALEKKLNK